MTTTWDTSSATADVTFSADRLTATTGTATNTRGCRATTGKSSGKWVFEVKAATMASNKFAVGLANAAYDPTRFLGNDANGVGFFPVSPPQSIWFNFTDLTSGTTADVTGAVVTVAVDLDAKLIWFTSPRMRTDVGAAAWNNSLSADPAAGTGGVSFTTAGLLYPAFNAQASGEAATLNAGATTFSHAIPTGFQAWDAGAAASIVPPYRSPFYAVEIDAKRPGSSTITFDEGHATHPHGALAQLPDVAEADDTVTVSDTGYRTLGTDPDGVVAYPPLVAEAFNISRMVGIAPADSPVGAGWSWGPILLSNPHNRFDAIAAAWNNDGRRARVLLGYKSYDRTRRLFTDPAYGTLVPMFVGVSTPWFLSDTQLQVPIRDATYWLERSLQSTQYLGSGTYEGMAALAGQPKPKCRGQVFNVSPVLVDPASGVYQYNDGPGTVQHIYEGGKAVFTNAGDTTDLYASAPASGTYMTDNSRGLFRLTPAAGSGQPIHTLTCDVTGSFPAAGLKSNWADIARYLLTEDLLLPSENIDEASFVAAATLYAYAAGVYFGPADSPDGVTAIGRILSGVGARLVPYRDGTLRLFMLRDPGTTPPAFGFDTSNCQKITPRQLPAQISPPPYRIRVPYAHNYTVQTSDLNATLTDTQKDFIAAADRFAAWISNDVLNNYRRPNDVTLPFGVLVNQADAQTVANDLGDLFGVRRLLFDAVVPADIGVGVEIGGIGTLTYPSGDLSSGPRGIVVGDAFRSNDGTITFTVLV